MSAETTEDTTTQDDATSQTDDATGTNGAGDDERRYSQSDIDRIVKDRLERAAEKARKEREKAEAAARDKALADQQEYKTLAEQRAERLAQLEPLTEQVETLTQERDAALAVVTSLVEQELTAAPDFVRDAIAEKSPVDQLAYITKHRDKWTQGKPQGIGPTANGNRPGPQTREDIKNRYLKQMGRSA